MPPALNCSNCLLFLYKWLSGDTLQNFFPEDFYRGANSVLNHGGCQYSVVGKAIHKTTVPRELDPLPSFCLNILVTYIFLFVSPFHLMIFYVLLQTSQQ